MAKARSAPALSTDRDGLAARRGATVAIVAARFNEPITRSLVDAAVRALARHGVGEPRVRIVWVPGAFELPVAAAAAAANRPDAIIALGCLVKGETSQYAAIGHAAAQGLMQVSVMTRIPVAFGVIIAETFEQAQARAGGQAGNRGEEAALAALEMLDVMATTRATRSRPRSR